MTNALTLWSKISICSTRELLMPCATQVSTSSLWRTLPTSRWLFSACAGTSDAVLRTLTTDSTRSRNSFGKVARTFRTTSWNSCHPQNSPMLRSTLKISRSIISQQARQPFSGRSRRESRTTSLMLGGSHQASWISQLISIHLKTFSLRLGSTRTMELLFYPSLGKYTSLRILLISFGGPKWTISSREGYFPK